MKFQIYLEQIGCHMSPSMRREWIEMQQSHFRFQSRFVSLHAEGVD